MVEAVVKSKVEWPELKFPPLNLHNMWKTTEWANYHASQQDPSLWETEDKDD